MPCLRGLAHEVTDITSGIVSFRAHVATGNTPPRPHAQIAQPPFWPGYIPHP